MPVAKISLEDIGGNVRQYGVPGRAWVAQVSAFSGVRGRRFFLKPFVDYSQSNSVGSRGVYRHYFLEEGKVYEVSEPLSWGRTEEYFCRVENGQIVKMEREEAEKWLRDRLVSTYSRPRENG